MKISEKFDLKKSQFELDFVDVDENRDTPLFLDPYYISKCEYSFAETCYGTIKSFFEYLLQLLRNKNIEEALSALVMLGFVKAQASKVLDKIAADNPTMTVEELIKQALKVL